MDALCGFPPFSGFPGVFGRPDPGTVEYAVEARFGTYGSPDPASAWCRPRLSGPSPFRGQAPDDRPASQAADVLPSALAAWSMGRRFSSWPLARRSFGAIAARQTPRALQEDVGRALPARAWRSSRTTRAALSVTETPWTQAVGHRCRHRPRRMPSRRPRLGEGDRLELGLRDARRAYVRRPRPRTRPRWPQLAPARPPARAAAGLDRSLARSTFRI